jgi:hypothetical protein
MSGREAIFAQKYCQINTNTTFAAMTGNGRSPPVASDAAQGREWA